MIEPITITAQNIFKELSVATSVDWLLANIGDKIRIETTFKVQVVAISSNDSPIWLNYTDGVLGVGWVWDPGNQFANFKVGDAVKIWNQFPPASTYDAGDFTIIAKANNGMIQLDHAVPAVGNDYAVYTLTISNKTAITAVKYRYNTIKNNAAPTFISAIDGVSEQLFVIDSKLASDTSSSTMRAMGPYEWQDGFTDGAVPPQAKIFDFGGTGVYPCTIAGVSIDTGAADGIYKSTYKITHYTKINPFILYQMVIPPFVDSNCLKLITKIDAMKLFSDPNILHSAVKDNIIGNVGWYGENYNTGTTNYSITNLTYKVAGVAVPSIQLDTTETVIEFDINNTVAAPFTDFPTGTEYVIGFHKVPADPSEYLGTGKLLDVNFLFDRLYGAVGGSANNGINYGGTYQVLKGYASAYTTTSVLHIKVGIKMVAAVLASFGASSNPQYFISIALRKRSLATNVGDDVCLEIDQNTFYTVTSDPTMIVFDNKNCVLRHPESNPVTEGIVYPATVPVFPEDELVGYSAFYIESATRLTDDIKITSLKAQVVAFNGTTTFVLDEHLEQTGSYPAVGYAQYFDQSVSDQFHLPVAETLRKYYNVKRRIDLDTGTRFYFSVNYPFLLRWETWALALGVPAVFFTTASPNNGWNQWWFHYAASGYLLYYKITVNATKNGVAQQYTQLQRLVPNDYSTNAAITIKTIKTYDLAGTQLVSGANSYVSGFADTEVRVVFKNTLAPFIPPADSYTAGVVVVSIEAFESGGIAGKRRYSSKWPADSDTWFLAFDSINTPLKVSLSVAGDSATYHTITAKVLIDYTMLPANITAFKITARLYDNTAGTYQEECITQKVLLIPASPVPQTATPNVPVNPLPGCCNDFVIQVLADATGIALQNDVTGFLYWFDPIVTGATMDLYKYVNGVWTLTVTNITSGTTYGTIKAFGTFVNDEGQNFVGVQLDWQNVLFIWGTGSYKMKVNYTVPVFGNQNFYSHEYCLQTYSPVLADGTVRLEYWLNGVTGDIEDDTKFKDFGNIDWYNSLRVKGYFGYPKSSYKSDDIEYNSGQRVFVEDSQEPVYTLKLNLLPNFLHEIIRTDFMMADTMAVTDYNSKNNATYIQKYVRKNSGYEPKWYPLQSNLASVEIQLLQAFNNFRKLR